MVVGDDEAKVRAQRAQAIGLFRYQLIREAADPAHSTKQRGKMVRELASREHIDPFGRRVRISRQTIDRWMRDWRSGGFDALTPSPRQCTPRTPAEVLELAVALRRENPERTAAAMQRILRTQLGWAPDERTLQRNFHRLGLAGRTATQSPAVFGRFEAAAPNDLWTGDVLHGTRIALRKTYLFAFLDDHSRLLAGPTSADGVHTDRWKWALISVNVGWADLGRVTTRPVVVRGFVSWWLRCRWW